MKYAGNALLRLNSHLFSFEGAVKIRPLGQAVKTAASHAANRSSILLGVTIYAPLAQLVEHLTLNQGVQGSSP